MELNRRKYLAVSATLLGVSGCLSDNTMTEQEAENEFEDVKVFKDPETPANNSAVRMVDEEAGVVIYAMARYEGIGLSALPKKDTDL